MFSKSVWSGVARRVLLTVVFLPISWLLGAPSLWQAFVLITIIGSLLDIEVKLQETSESINELTLSLWRESWALNKIREIRKLEEAEVEPTTCEEIRLQEERIEQVHAERRRYKPLVGNKGIMRDQK